MKKDQLKPCIFVFGSNLLGIHGAGAARTARLHYKAETGHGTGRTGNAYAIPTKRDPDTTLPLEEIAYYIKIFITHAKAHPQLDFKVTRIGCGLAGYTDADISPMFIDAPPNCHLPQGWRKSNAKKT